MTEFGQSEAASNLEVLGVGEPFAVVLLAPEIANGNPEQSEMDIHFRIERSVVIRDAFLNRLISYQRPGKTN